MKVFVLLSYIAVLAVAVTATPFDPLTHTEERQDGQDEGPSNDIVKQAIANDETVVLEPVADSQQVVANDQQRIFLTEDEPSESIYDIESIDHHADAEIEYSGLHRSWKPDCTFCKPIRYCFRYPHCYVSIKGDHILGADLKLFCTHEAKC